MSRVWVVAYDIADDRRRKDAARVLGEHLDRVQESLFEGELSTSRQREIEARLALIIDAAADSVRFYPLLLRDARCRRTYGAMPALSRRRDFWLL